MKTHSSIHPSPKKKKKKKNLRHNPSMLLLLLRCATPQQIMRKTKHQQATEIQKRPNNETKLAFSKHAGGMKDPTLVVVD